MTYDEYLNAAADAADDAFLVEMDATDEERAGWLAGDDEMVERLEAAADWEDTRASLLAADRAGTL